MEEKPFPWPQKGDQLFNPGEDWWLSAYIQPWNKDFSAYAEGYKKAADIVTDHVTTTSEGDRSVRDYVVFPVAFLYRHYIELRLKEILLVGGRLYDLKERLPKHHRIDELWKHARSIVKETSASEDLDVMDACISEFAKMDQNSQSFRYPVDRDGNQSIKPDQLVISLPHLRDVMERLGSFLDTAADYLHILYQQKCEMDSY